MEVRSNFPPSSVSFGVSVSDVFLAVVGEDEEEDSVARLRPLTPYGELSTRIIISLASGS